VSQDLGLGLGCQDLGLGLGNKGLDNITVNIKHAVQQLHKTTIIEFA